MGIRKQLRNYLNRNIKAARAVTVLPDDTFIVSYPKSGNTWVRFLIANLINPENKIGFDNIEEIIPDIYRKTPRQLAIIPQPRFLKSHEYFDPRYGKVIYIVRDPRDVAVSYWHHYLKFKVITESYPIEQFVDRFLTGDLGPFGSWGTNVGSWLGAREHDEDFLLLRYEDLLHTPAIELGRIMAHLNLPADKQIIERAIANSSFQRMQSMEQVQGHQWDLVTKSDQGMAFVRNGTHGQWRNQLPVESIRKIEMAWGTLMSKLGYCSD
jgi:hypothetical protein